MAFLVLTLCQSTAALGDWWGTATSNDLIAPRYIRAVTQTQLNGDETDIYYPATTADPEAPASYPLVIFLQGALVDKTYYSHFAQELAQHGFVVAIPNHRSPLFGGNDLFSSFAAITDTLEHMRSETNAPDSPLYGIVDTNRLSLSGHSFGGLTALMAAGNTCQFPVCNPGEGFTRPPELVAVAAVAGHVSQLDIDTTGIAVAITVGEFDSDLNNYYDTYANLASPKALMLVNEANHFGMADISEPPGASIDPDDIAQTIPQAVSASRFARWSGLFLRTHNYYDWKPWVTVYRTNGDEDTTVESQW